LDDFGFNSPLLWIDQHILPFKLDKGDDGRFNKGGVLDEFKESNFKLVVLTAERFLSLAVVSFPMDFMGDEGGVPGGERVVFM